MSNFIENLLRRHLEPGKNVQPHTPGRFEPEYIRPSGIELIDAVYPDNSSDQVIHNREINSKLENVFSAEQQHFNDIQSDKKITSTETPKNDTSKKEMKSIQVTTDRGDQVDNRYGTPEMVDNDRPDEELIHPITNINEEKKDTYSLKIPSTEKELPENQDQRDELSRIKFKINFEKIPENLPEIEENEMSELVARPPENDIDPLLPDQQKWKPNESNTRSIIQNISTTRHIDWKTELNKNSDSEAQDHKSVPTIKVNIGRIEVRAVMEQNIPPQQAKKIIKPNLSLEDYLNNKDKGII